MAVSSTRDPSVSVPTGTYEGLSDRARSQSNTPLPPHHPNNPTLTPQNAFSTSFSFLSPPASPSPRNPSSSNLYNEFPSYDPNHPDAPASTGPRGRAAHTFGEGTCYPGCKSDLHSTVSRDIPLTSPLCGLLRDLPFEEIVDLAYMFNYNDDERCGYIVQLFFTFSPLLPLTLEDVNGSHYIALHLSTSLCTVWDGKM